MSRDVEKAITYIECAVARLRDVHPDEAALRSALLHVCMELREAASFLCEILDALKEVDADDAKAAAHASARG